MNINAEDGCPFSSSPFMGHKRRAQKAATRFAAGK
jgi:hypothetical protein